MLKSLCIIWVAFALAGCASVDLSSRERLPENSFAWDGPGSDPGETARTRRPMANHTPAENQLAWDGLGPDPSVPAARRPRATKKPANPTSSMASMSEDAADLAAVPKYSKEWVALFVAKQVKEDAKLDQAIVICRGC
jgi:hypothetical protein